MFSFPLSVSYWLPLHGGRSAKDDETERTNVKTVTALVAHVAKGDTKAIAALTADDVIWHYVAGNEGAQSGTAAYTKALDEFIGMTSERKMEPTGVWAAADWVVAEVKTTATMNKDFGKAKTKGKTGTQNEVHFFQLAEGKVKRHYLFANDLAMATQLGMIDPASLAPKKDAKK